MLKATRTRLGSPAWLAIGLVMLIPALAEAQLFPNRTIRREKPSCASEPPFYKQVRRDYFGYYPTCWSRFPAGWACPCPDNELAQMRADFDKNKPKLDLLPVDTGTGGTGEEDRGMDDPNTKPAPTPKPADPFLPEVPRSNSTSPFNLDPTTPKPTTPGPGPGARIAPSSPSNLEIPSLPATSPTSSNEPTVNPGSLAMYPDDAVLTSSNTNLRPDLGPLPSAPTPAPFTPVGSSNSVSVSTTTPIESETVLGTPAPAQAPKRRSLLSQLFGRNNTTTQNR